MMDKTQLVDRMTEFFRNEGWTIEYLAPVNKNDPPIVEALMPSGYGSGPAVINLGEFADFIIG